MHYSFSVVIKLQLDDFKMPAINAATARSDDKYIRENHESRMGLLT
jgi:hypothetical protein